ncbi:pyrroline-5-carboxylate reductase [Maricaulis maris MCS10]|uniref:Pyrroline-5-carboxylate reductase n=1 Tax=Maricaulis maris (strain MCS10) TaxID=394221 RepID=Q0ARN0_MARMM|nr:pyrroline-5-carboxylate reductase [Maricaulis maris]ABI65057.1 pyrroline-5-carboxylate reductase [Maricaulis maris MCS10]
MAQNFRIALIGGGNMGGALAAGWLRTKRGAVAADELVVIDPSPGEVVQDLASQSGVAVLPELTADAAATLELAVLAVKPQIFEQVATSLADALPVSTGVVSIMAGVTLNRLTMALGERAIVRAMPNTAAAVGAGVSVCVANEAGEALEKTVTRLLKTAGTVEWVADERMIGAVTAVSGSGPAYVFLLAEALAGAAFAEGLPRELADKLARETIIGAGALLAKSGKLPQELRRAVTSPNGTTQAAVDVLMGAGGGLPELVRQAVAAAERRSRQMGQDPGKR